jgi:hypothetical protein
MINGLLVWFLTVHVFVCGLLVALAFTMTLPAGQWNYTVGINGKCQQIIS